MMARRRPLSFIRVSNIIGFVLRRYGEITPKNFVIVIVRLSGAPILKLIHEKSIVRLECNYLM